MQRAGGGGVLVGDVRAATRMFCGKRSLLFSLQGVVHGQDMCLNLASQVALETTELLMLQEPHLSYLTWRFSATTVPSF